MALAAIELFENPQLRAEARAEFDARRGAAKGTGVDVDWEIIHGNHPLLINETLAKMMHEKLNEVGGIEYNEREEAFAKELYPTLTSPELPLGSQAVVQPYGVKLGYGSTDVGDVSMPPTA